jgi:hypothetical protein
VAQGADVVILRGGTRIELKQPWAIQGKTALLTRPDGTLLSLPVSEIDREATRAANAAPASSSASSALLAPPASPAEAARATRERPQARLRITDADVGHEFVPTGPEVAKETEKTVSGSARVEVASYEQTQDGTLVVVKGTLRNVGSTNATSVRLTVSGVNEKGMSFVTSEASVSRGLIEPGNSVAFGASLEIGDAVLTSFRFAPQWIAAAPPAAPGSTAPGRAGAGSAPASGGAEAPPPPAAAAPPPGPTPLPYGMGVLYAAPPPNAPLTRPADGRTGYIPGASSPDQQPKPPQ